MVKDKPDNDTLAEVLSALVEAIECKHFSQEEIESGQYIKIQNELLNRAYEILAEWENADEG